MKSPFDSARSLIRYARAEQLPRLVAAHADCIDKKAIVDEFCIEVAHLLGSLRSALDYCFTNLHERFVTNKRSTPHFPIYDHPNAFEAAMVNNYPGLPAETMSYLRTIQPYQHADNLWIALLRKENNFAKHTNFTAHSVVERRAEVHAVTDTGGVAIVASDEGSGVQIEPGGRI